ncbi:unnamed protein product [Brachionus calyciflorus]|uniref:Ion transport domain-containing protein n=1 Tax=Brachionus calyciflorus TaxID=104777 RepID=A0A813WNP7_9BILA|nr:unnamed protein product [Brachionus calyciflorus]
MNQPNKVKEKKFNGEKNLNVRVLEGFQDKEQVKFLECSFASSLDGFYIPGNITEIYFVRCGLKKIDLSIFSHLSQIEILDLHFNEIDTIKGMLSEKNLISLKKIDLSINIIENLPDFFPKFPLERKSKTIEINLKNNLLATLSDTLINLLKNDLIVINLGGNNLRKFENYWEFKQIKFYTKDIFFNNIGGIIRNYNNDNFWESRLLKYAIDILVNKQFDFKDYVFFQNKEKNLFEIKTEEEKNQCFKSLMYRFFYEYKMLENETVKNVFDSLYVEFVQKKINLIDIFIQMEMPIFEYIVCWIFNNFDLYKDKDPLKLISPKSFSILCQQNTLLQNTLLSTLISRKIFKNLFEKIDDNDFSIVDENKTKNYPCDFEYFLQIDFKNFFTQAYKNDNKIMAIHLLLFIRISILYFLTFDKFSNPNYKELDLFVINDILIDWNWYDLIDFVKQKLFDEKYSQYKEKFKTYKKSLTRTKKKKELSKKELCCFWIENSVSNKEEDEPFLNDNAHKFQRDIDNLQDFYSSEKVDFLNENIERIINDVWKGVPRFVYYSNLIAFIVYLILLNIYIENFKTSDQIGIKISILIFAFYFELLELIQFILAVKNREILSYLTSIKNLFEIFTFTICIVALFLDTNNQFNEKTALLTLAILFSFFIFIFRLNKAWRIGSFINLIGSIIKNSIPLFLIIIFCLIGFSLSFRNRAKTNVLNVKPIQFFNTTFELSFFRIFTMALGSLSTDDMGVESISGLGFVNCALYATFILIMPVLLFNIFTSIAFRELKNMNENAKIDKLRHRIEYIIKIIVLLKFLSKSFNFKRSQTNNKSSNSTNETVINENSRNKHSFKEKILHIFKENLNNLQSQTIKDEIYEVNKKNYASFSKIFEDFESEITKFQNNNFSKLNK